MSEKEPAKDLTREQARRLAGFLEKLDDYQLLLMRGDWTFDSLARHRGELTKCVKDMMTGDAARASK